MAGIITQVSQTPVQAHIQPPLLTRLSLELRGKRFSVDRETIMNLPESVLLCLFPNGLVLSRQATSLGDGAENSEEEEVYGVDVRPWILLSPPIQHLNLASAAKHIISSPLHSLTPNVFPLSSNSFAPPLMPSMGPIQPLAFILHNNTSSIHHLLPTLLLTRILSSQSKPSSFYGKNWNIFPYRPRVARLPQM